MSVSGMNSLPGSAVKPRAVRRPASATNARAAPAPVPAARLSTSRTARASRPSYAESDDLDSDLEEESESEVSESSESESSDAEEPENTAEDVRNATMSPTKQFVLNSTGKTKKVVAKKSSAVKKISFADDGDAAPVKGRRAAAKKTAD